MSTDEAHPAEGGREWFAVRCIFGDNQNKPWGPHDLENEESAYEERITLWRALDFDEAIARAEADAHEYAEVLECEYLGLAQAFRLAESPGDGAEVFSLIRKSRLITETYLSGFFDTGLEYQAD